MRSSTFGAAALYAVLASVAAAQSTAPGSPPPTAPQASGTTAGPKSNDDAATDKAATDKAKRDGELSADMAAVLRKAGFTDLQVLPNSVLVRGKNKAGQSVAMVLNPGSMTEVVTLDPHAGSAAGGNGATLTGSGTFATVLPTEKLASALIGAGVVDATGDKVGTIKDLAIDHGGVHAYIVGVGGLFGIGDRYVAITPGALTLAYDAGAKTFRATIGATREQLKAAPEFKFDDLAVAKRD